MAKLKVKKGLEANLPAVEDGSLLITTDSKKLYLDNGEERIQVGGDSSSAGTYLFHLKFTDGMETAVTNIDGDFSKLSAAVTNGMNVIARVHDYEDMLNFTDYYLATGTGSSTSPASPYELNYYDGLKLHSIVVNDFTDSGLSYSTSSTGVRTIVFTKTSDTEYSCSIDVALIVEENAVVGKVPNEDNNGYTFFYKVWDSIDTTSATPSDTVATTFISCDGNVIKKLTSQYSDYGVWHYSEQSLSGGGGADSSIYTEDGIVKSDGVKFKQSSTADPYTTISKNSNDVEIVANVPTTVTTTTLSKLTLGAQVNGGSQPVTQKLVWDSAGINSSLPALYPVNELGHVNGLGTPSSPWTNANINSLDNTHYVCWNNSSTSIFSSLQIGSNQTTPSVIIDSDRVTLRSSNTTTGSMNSQQESEILADTSLGATPSGSDFASSRLKLTVRQSGGPVGSGQSKDHSLVFGFTDAITCKFYTDSVVDLGSSDNPWGNMYLGRAGRGSIYKQGEDLSYITSGSKDSILFISNALGTLPTTVTSTAGGTSYIKFDMNSWYHLPSETTYYTGDGQIIMSTFNNSSQVDVKLYPNVSGSANLNSPSYSSYLGDSQNPWTYLYCKYMYINGRRVNDFIAISNSGYLSLTPTQMNGLPGSGKYMKRVWGSGMQEVWIELELGDITTWDSWGSLYEHVYGKAVQWPVAWAVTPQVIMSASCSTDAVWITPINPTATNTGAISIKTSGNVTRTDIKVHIYATGLQG